MWETRDAFDANLREWSSDEEDGDDTIDDPDPVYWGKTQPDRTDENYNQTVIVWTNVGRFQYTHAEWKVKMKKLKSMIRAQFQLEHEICWLGIVETFKTPGVPDSGGRLDLFFRVHNDERSKLFNSVRIDLGFNWFFDEVFDWPGQRIYPLHFRRMYRP